VLLAPVFWVAVPRPFRGEPLPNPNGYDDLVAAGKSITGDMPMPASGDYSEADPEVLRTFVEQNRKALSQARVGLARESRVRLPDAVLSPVHDEAMTALRVLSRLFACEAALAEHDGETERALKVSLDGIRLGHAAGHGGTVIENLMGAALESFGISGLSRLASEASPDDARRLAAEVLKIEAAREPINRVLDRDLDFHRTTGIWQVRALITFRPGTVKTMNAPRVKSTEHADRRVRAFLRLLTVKLALRAYEREHPGEPPPKSLDALVPGYLAAVPVDPFGTGPLKLRVEETGARPYSIGPDGKDDGGNPVGKVTRFNPTAPGDMTLDAP
jgi:hypothetical protein